MVNKNIKLAVIGLGYVGLPLALAFSKKRHVIAFDIDEIRVKQLIKGNDKNREFKKEEIQFSKKIKFTSNKEDLGYANYYIITVPTPVNRSNKPNLNPLINASKIVSKFLKQSDIVIYESTVFPGCVEEVCVPILEKFSNLIFNKNFFCGYSPERINPGDKNHTIENIKKITSGSTTQTANLVDGLYKEIVKAGTHRASNIKVAEAAKVIENTQRDLNIALINELSILFSKMNLETQDILEAAASKWNFLHFKPGLVGGHCIGVDPYYLTYKAESIGYQPKVILSGRKINESMGRHVATSFVRICKKKKIKIIGSNVLLMGLTFKENCADIRNSGIKSVIRELKKFHFKISLYDPWVDDKEIYNTFKIRPISNLKKNIYDGIIIAVAHDEFKKMGIRKIQSLCRKKSVIFDLKYLFSKDQTDLRL